MIDKDREFKEKHHREVFLARGGALELSTMMEKRFNEILSKIGKEKIPYHFMTKAILVENLMLKLTPEIEREKFKTLQDFVTLRNIFAHAPIKWKLQKLEFESEGQYKKFFKTNPEWKNFNIAINHFNAISGRALDLIENFIIQFNKSEQLKRMLEKQLLGGLSVETLENAMDEDMKKFYEKVKDRDIESFFE